MNTADGGTSGGTATTRENHFGVVHTDRTTKPAAAAITAKFA